VFLINRGRNEGRGQQFNPAQRLKSLRFPACRQAGIPVNGSRLINNPPAGEAGK